MYQKILVPMALDHDVSPRTLQIARSLAAPGAEIIALHVHEVHESVSIYLQEKTLIESFERAKNKMDEKLAGIEGVTPVIVKGHAARTIIDYADSHGVDCIVIGSHKPDLSDYLLGSTAARVVRHASSAVHVHRSNTPSVPYRA